MSQTIYKYDPDYSVPPGWLVEEILETRNWNQAELARRCNCSPKTISEIVNGKAPITPKTALQFERILDVPALTWINMESNYRLREEKIRERKELQKRVVWAKSFPIKELVERGIIEKPVDSVEKVDALLDFFGYGSVETWKERYQSLTVQYRESQTFKSRPEDIFSWLRIGELIAEEQETPPFNKKQFKKALYEIRGLTNESPRVFFPKMEALCKQSGVVVSCVPPIGKNRLSGAAYWLTPSKAIILMTLRYKTNDHFWYTFFHEAGHILLHGKKEPFIDSEKNECDQPLEIEANEFATNLLVPKRVWNRFINDGSFRKDNIIEFSNLMGIAPGIIVGMLQHDRKIPYNRFHLLKDKFEWAS